MRTYCKIPDITPYINATSTPRYTAQILLFDIIVSIVILSKNVVITPPFEC